MEEKKVAPLSRANKFNRYHEEVKSVRHELNEKDSWESFVLGIAYDPNDANSPATLNYQIFSSCEEGKIHFEKFLNEFEGEFLMAGFHNRKGEVEGFFA